MPELKPCPFCGGEAELGSPIYYVECTSCMGGVPSYDSMEEAISAWNRRSPPAAVPDGWVMVPNEPTREMAIAAVKALDDATVSDPKAAGWDAIRAYRAMISAAPAAPTEARDE